MKPRNEQQKLTEGQSRAKKPRFKIEKLEERIAPGGVKHPGPHGGGGNNGYPPGRCHYNGHPKGGGYICD